MRSDPSEVKSKGRRARSLSGSRRDSARRSMLRRLALEGLETRTLLATLPTPSVLQGSLVDISNSQGDESTPTIAVDKNNPQKLAAVWVRHDTTLAPGPTIFVEGAFSNDGGQSWSRLGSIGIIADPTTSNPIQPYDTVTDPGIAFDRNDNLYILTEQHNSTTGNPSALTLTKYNFSGSAPSLVFSNKVVYQSLQDAAVSPTLAVDDNLPSFTDTDAFGQTYTQTDPYSGNVYIAWGTNNTPPQNATNYNPNQIMMIASSDGGQNFSGPVTVSSRGAFGDQRYTSPRLAISQGRPRNTALYGANDQGVPGGQVTIVYDDFGTLATASPVPMSIIFANRAQGAVSQVVHGPNGAIAINTPNTAPPIVNSFPVNVNITDTDFTTLSDLSVSIIASHQNTANLRIVLVPPTGSGLQPFTLVAPSTITGANLGVITNNGIQFPTIFTDNGSKDIGNQASSSPYMGYYRPTGGSLANAYRGASRAQLNGTWTLEITDTTNGNAGSLIDWSINFLSGMAPAVERQVTTSDVLGGLGGTYPLKTPASAGPGIGPAPTIASDNTLGAFSPNQGTLYIAYVDHIYNAGLNPAANTDIFLATSTDGGLTWNLSGLPVNDDDGARDGYSESTSGGLYISGRTQYQPQVVVDDATGTVVLSWLDARHDSSNSRVSTYLTASLDGGRTFSSQIFANAPQTAIDAISQEVVTLGPIPENQATSPVADTAIAFGTRQGLAVYGGKVYPAWSSNLNGGSVDADGIFFTGDGRGRLDIRTATILIAGGPRIIASTMGPVGLPGDTVNPGSSTPTVSAFEVTFDRPVDATSFTADDVSVFFRDTTADNATGGEVPVLNVVPILTPGDPLNPNNIFGYTRFKVTFEPRTGTGTYSYVIKPVVRDAIRSRSTAVTPVGNPVTFAATGPEVPQNIANQFLTDSTVQVTAPAGRVVSNVTVNVTVRYPYTYGLVLTLIAPDGTRVPLSQFEPGFINYNPDDTTGFINTTFSDTAPTAIGDAQNQPPYTGTFRPDTPLSALIGRDPNGTWTLEIQNAFFQFQGVTGSLLNWSMTLRTGVVSTEAGAGNRMDQNADSITGQEAQSGGGLGDTYAAPSPTSGNLIFTDGEFFPAPYDQDTLPLILAGPHVIGSNVPGAPTTDDNLVRNATVNSIDVTFDRPMNPATFTPDKILRIMGPSGLIQGPFTVTPDPLGNDPDSPRTFRIGFPTQFLNGTYRITLDSSIESAAGEELDTNLNAGVDLLKQTPGAPVAPVSFASPIVPVTIAPQQTVTSVVPVPAGFLAQGVTLQLNINYPRNPDLKAELIGPDGQTIVLFDGIGATGGTPGFSNTIFDDAAATPIQNGGPPFFGRFKPQEPLSAFNGIAAGGNWTLQITNTAPTDSGRTGSLTSWSLTFQRSVPDSGLGEPVADQATIGFRLLSDDPTNPLTTSTWTSVGPASISNVANTNGYAGSAGGFALDPSDPSGNTAFVGGASGGVWKTTNFLTTDPAGPTYIPLTDFGPSFSLNIGSIAVFGRNNDPNQSIIIAGTGNANALYGLDGNTSQGVGFLRSMDGGATWTLLDSTNNNLEFDDRDHLFAANGGTSTFKVIVDPRPTPNGEVIIYAAMGGTSGGLWRSVDTGDTWQKMSTDSLHGTTATDVLLDLNSATVDAISNPTGNVNVIYAAFQGNGVYISPNRGQTLTQMAGGNVAPLIRDPEILNPQPQAIAVNNGTFPIGQGQRIVLAKPALVPDTDPRASVKNLLYESWLYAAVANTNGRLLGLYVTKDNGTTWTKVYHGTFPTELNADAIPSNNPSHPLYDPAGSATDPNASYHISVAVDPTDPEIVYLGGTSTGQDSGLIRIDISGIFDSHAAVAYSGTRPQGGIGLNTLGGVALKNVNDGRPILSTLRGNVFVGATVQPYTNLVADPNQLFLANSTLYLSNVSSFTNDGSGITWTPFDELLKRNGGDFRPSSGIHQILTIVDPLTGHSRLIVGNDQGFFTGVDRDGTLTPGISDAVAPTYSRNGNLQVAQYYYGAAQPSNVARQASQAAYYGNGVHTGYGQSTNTPGDTEWSAPTNPSGGEQGGVGVQVSQQGGMPDPNNPGQILPTVVYQYAFPGLGGVFSDFFQVSVGGGPFIGRTSGLVQTGNDPQWPLISPNYPRGVAQGNFAVNPLNSNQVIISSNAGRIFSTTNQGQSWLVIGDPGALDGTYAPALTFAAPDPNSPGGVGNLNNFLYAGTVGGKIFVTTTGGGTPGVGNAWTDISTGLDGSAVLKIVANPTRGSHAAYAVTQNGVYVTSNSLATTGPIWTNITGNLFGLTTAPFGDEDQARPQAQYLTSIVADWRYVIPNNPSAPSGPTHPVLYVSAESGVYRSLDNGTTWSLFPDNAAVPGSTASTPPPGGLLPNVHVSDLTLAVGNIDPTTGRPVAQQGDPNDLVAATFGRGMFTIRLAPIVFPNTPQSTNIRLDPNLPGPNGSDNGLAPDGVTPMTTVPRPFIDGFSQQSAFGNQVFISFYDLSNPNSPRLIGGFNPNDPSTRIAANQTDASGRFAIQLNEGAYTSNGTKTIGIQATDASGTRGNMATFTFLLNATLPQPNPPATPTLVLSPVDDSSGGQKITNVAEPHLLGATDANTTVELFLSSGGQPTGSALLTGTTDADGNYIFQFEQSNGQRFPDGTYTVQTRATNIFGFSDSVPLTFTIDTTKPVTAPTLSLNPSDDTGIVGDGITASRRPHFIGTVGVAEAGAIITLFNANNTSAPLAEVTADANGNFAVQLPFNLSDGTISLVASARDIAGNQGPLSSPPFLLRVETVPGDYLGNARANQTLFRRTSPVGTWFIGGLTGPGGIPFGTPDAVPIQGDFVGDGSNQLAAYDPNTATWFIQGVFPNGIQFGQAHVDIPVPGDYYGRGVDTLATFRPNTGEWFIGGRPGAPPKLGKSGDIPVPGDYDGNGTTDLAVYTPTTAVFTIMTDINTGATRTVKLGTPGQIPVPGQYDNTADSRRTEPAVYDPTTGLMTVLNVGTNATRTYQFIPGMIPAPNDYDGVGGDQPAAYNTFNSTWTIYGSGSSVPHFVTFGGPSDVPVAAPYNFRRVPVSGDYDGTSRAQFTVFRRTSPQAHWFIGGVTGPNGVTFGGPNDIPLQGMFTGSGRTNLASFNPSTATWRVEGLFPNGVAYGAPNLDIPAPADYYGNGVTSIAVFRPTTGDWYLAGHKDPIARLGGPGDTPVPGNYDGSGKAQIAVFQPASGNRPTRWLISNPGGIQAINFGGPNDVPVPGDYDRLGKTQLATYRPETSEWFIGGHANPIQFGGPGDIPVPADYDGVGFTQLAVYRPSTNQLFIAGHAQPVTFGGPGDVPVTAPLAYRVPGANVGAKSLDFGGQAAALSAASASSAPAPAPASQPQSQSTAAQSSQAASGNPKVVPSPTRSTVPPSQWRPSLRHRIHDLALDNASRFVSRFGKRPF